MDSNKFKWLVVLITCVYILTPVSGEICECSSCEDCTEKIANPSCTEVRLINDIYLSDLGSDMDCISFEDINNVVFNCQGHRMGANTTVFKDGYVYLREHTSYINGINLLNSSNNKIINCVLYGYIEGIAINRNSNDNLIANITLFLNYEGISLFSSSNNIIKNNNIYHSSEGIGLRESYQNLITSNIVYSNVNGIYAFDNANSNKVSDNKIYNNTEAGIFMGDWDGCVGKRCAKRVGTNDNFIVRNEISGNPIGIKAASSNLTAENNILSGNEWDFVFDDRYGGNSTIEVRGNLCDGSEECKSNRPLKEMPPSYPLDILMLIGSIIIAIIGRVIYVLVKRKR